jgi:hypothetical protein
MEIFQKAGLPDGVINMVLGVEGHRKAWHIRVLYSLFFFFIATFGCCYYYLCLI